MRLEQDLGFVAADSKRKVDFEVNNTSEKDWELKEVIKTCGCLLAEKPAPMIAAHSRSQVQLTLSAGRKSGDFTRCLRLKYSNSLGDLNLCIKMRVRNELDFSPHQVQFPRSPIGLEVQSVIRVENWSTDLWDGVDVTSESSWMRFNVSPIEIHEPESDTAEFRLKQAWDLTVVAIPPASVPGRFVDFIDIQSLGGQHTQRVSVTGEVQHPVIVRPNALVLGREQRPDRPRIAHTQLTLQAKSGYSGMNIKSVQTDLGSDCEVSHSRISPNQIGIRLSLPPSWNDKAVSGNITIQFEDDVPVIVIPVVGAI